MIKIRLAKQGKRNNHFYRIVAVEKARKVLGRPLAVLGHWYPHTKSLKIDKDKLKLFLSQGAQFSPSVKKLTENK